MSSNQGEISQSSTGQMSGGMQAAIGNNNKQNMNTEAASTQKELSQEEVVKLLIDIQTVFETSNLPTDVKKR